MTADILKAMIKEEWRLFTSFIGGRLFACFPLLIATGVFIAALFLPSLQTIVTTEQLLRYAHYAFMIFGISIGAFGLFGKEVMNRRFGQASLLAYSSRSLPLSERTLFLNFFIKDIFYYLVLWILPITIGFLLATVFIDVSLISALLVCGTLYLSFLLGLSIVFFLSTVYAHSSKVLVGLLVLGGVVLFLLPQYIPTNIVSLALPYYLFHQPSITRILVILLLIIVPATVSLVFIKVDYPEKKRQYQKALLALTKKLQFTQYAAYVAKDMLDLKRSEGGLGKIIFQFLFPVALTWMFLSIFSELIPGVKAVMIFAIFLGIVSASIYNMLTAFDSFSPYMFLPVTPSTIIKSKLISYLLFNAISFGILLLASLSMQQIMYIVPAALCFVTISLYSLAMTIYFAGLHPSTFLYNAKIFSQYMAAVAPLLFIFTIASILDPFLMLASPLALLPALVVLKKSYVKWDRWQPISV